MATHFPGHGFLVAAAPAETPSDRMARLERNCAALRIQLADAKAELLLAAEALTDPHRPNRDAACERVHQHVEAM